MLARRLACWRATMLLLRFLVGACATRALTTHGQGTATLTVGTHFARGKRVDLKKPLAVLERAASASADVSVCGRASERA